MIQVDVYVCIFAFLSCGPDCSVHTKISPIKLKNRSEKEAIFLFRVYREAYLEGGPSSGEKKEVRIINIRT